MISCDLALILPVVVIVAAWTIRPMRFMTMAVSVLFWGQLAVVCCALSPVLSSQVPVLRLYSDFSIDKIGALFAVLTQVVVAASMTQAHFYFSADSSEADADADAKVRIFCCCTSLFSLAMSTVFFCDNLGLLWICIEGTTLCSAPLVYFQRGKNALEAAWKYLIICSVGIAFALFGTILIFASSQCGALPEGTLSIEKLIASAASLEYPWLKFGFLFCLVGYGTKAGLFPLSSWLPDAHAEAPAPASSMLSGGLLNCALFAILRIVQIVSAAGHQGFAQSVLVFSGVFTASVASLLLIRQHGVKRMLAYSSIENVGLMLIAIGLVSPGLFFILALNHSLAKVALFLLSGNIIQLRGTKSIKEIQGLLMTNPLLAGLFVSGVFAVTGAPPFGTFAGEWQLLSKLAVMQNWPAVAALLIALTVSFLAVTMHVGRMIGGAPGSLPPSLVRPFASNMVPAGLILLTLFAGIASLPAILRCGD